MRHKLGDSVVTSGAFYRESGVACKVVDVKYSGNPYIAVAEDAEGKRYVGSHADFFPSDKVLEEEPCCTKYNTKFCPECGSEL